MLHVLLGENISKKRGDSMVIPRESIGNFLRKLQKKKRIKLKLWYKYTVYLLTTTFNSCHCLKNT